MIEKYFPDMMVKKTWDIDLEVVKSHGVKGFVLDIDNTLVAPNMKDSSQEVIDWIQKVKGEGFKVCIVSNASRKRVARFNEKLKILAIHRALKPNSKAFLKAVMLMGIRPTETAVVGDQLFTDIIGGNRLNMFTILVSPIHPREPFFIKPKRWMERYILSQYRKEVHRKMEKRKVWKLKSARRRMEKTSSNPENHR